MTRPTTAKLPSAEQVPDSLIRLGGWLFKYRTSLPIPIVLVLLLVPSNAPTTGIRTFLLVLGILAVSTGEALRLWGVHHIGVISRTRSDRLGPLVDSGPFSMVRNPLYLGNVLLWVGFALSAGLPWFVPIVIVLLMAEYHAIVRWEERLLEARLGDAYRQYQREVPRWIPQAPRRQPEPSSRASFSWADTLYSERGTLIAIALGFALIALKHLVI